jgi:ribose-phosphate pyrophosphokinase
MRSKLTLHWVACELVMPNPINVVGTIQHQSLTFPGGEPHVVVNLQDAEKGALYVDARICDADGWLTLLALLDAVRAQRPRKLGLFCPYFPGARQDRRDGRHAFTAKVYAETLRPYELDSVVVLDPHSTVLAALFGPEFLAIDPAHPFVDAIPLRGYRGVIQPDAGAARRAEDFARMLDVPVYQATKHRDPDTGKLTRFACEPVPHGHYLVVDDVCDGGGTFVGLGEVLTSFSRHVTLDLVVSHGIFSKGTGDLLKYYQQIFTTDSFPMQTSGLSDRFTVVPLETVGREAVARMLLS